jgi:hypothetical protein
MSLVFAFSTFGQTPQSAPAPSPASSPEIADRPPQLITPIDTGSPPAIARPPADGSVELAAPFLPIDGANRPGDNNQFVPQLTGRGGGGPSASFMNPVVGNVPYHLGYRTTIFPDEPVKNQPTNLGYFQERLDVSLPICQDSQNEWTASVGVMAEFFHTSAILPDTGGHFPDELWNIHFGTGYRHLFDNGWIGGVNIHTGSASDQPFSTIHEMIIGGNLFLRVPQGEHNAWLFTLNYSTNSEVLNTFPIPGVAYFYAPTPWFQATVGFPFASVVYRPTDDLTLNLSYALLTTVHAKATYRLGQRSRVYAAFDMNNENYFLAERQDNRDRFFYYDDRFTVGWQWVLRPRCSLDLFGGYVFDRYYFEGRKLNDRNDNRIDVGSGPLAGLQFNVSF